MAVEWPHWGLAIDLDKCTGCQACVLACQAENNVPLSTEEIVNEQRAITWIRVQRYWEGEFPDVKARFIPVMCQHCGNAPCEPVCPMYATYHSVDGLNMQMYNRCVGTRYCANNCPYHARYFNYWEREWPETLKEQLNPDVSVRSKGIMEKCTLCVQRIRRAQRQSVRDGKGRNIPDGQFTTACAQACPSDALIFGIVSNENSNIGKLSKDADHAYQLLADLGTAPGVFYLSSIDPYETSHEAEKGGHGAATKEPAMTAQGEKKDGAH